VVAEVKAPASDVEAGARAIAGVRRVDATVNDGWVRIALEAPPEIDVREDLFRLSSSRGWSMRELRREGGTLEDFFVKVTAEQVRRAKS
jgi:hypothetical protein